MAPPLAPSAGRTGELFAGRYRLVEEIGHGGMGVVFRAEDTRLKRLVALKFLAHELSSDPDARARFFREAQTAAALDSPHVCTVYEVGEHGGQAFIAMALVEGGTLKARLAQERLPLAEVLTLACEIAGGLAAAHVRDVVHRDIKPANILLTIGGEARIADFGIARLGASSSDATGTGVVLGTLAYMAPEQAAGLPADARSDVWSAGCVFYQMLTGRTPFASPAGTVDLHALLHDPPPPIQASRPDTPPALAAVVERCLAKDPRARYENGSALLRALENVARSTGTWQPASPARAAAPTSGTWRRASAGRAAGVEVPLDSPAPPPPSLAVLPFDDMSPGQDQAYFGDGIAEELIHALAGIKELRVVARTSSFALKGKGLDVREIGRLLDVGAVLEGSVRAAGDKIRVTAQLVSVADGFHLWSERFDREAGDIFAIQDELSMAIVEHLKVSLRVEERDALNRRPTDDHEAYNLYLKGLYFVSRPGPEALQHALRYFDQALAADPGFARAWAGVGLVYVNLGNLGFAPPHDAWPKAKAAAQKALALDADLADAHAILAAAAFWYDWDWPAAEASFTRNLALHPGDAFSHGTYAWYLVSQRRFDECLREVKTAIALDPLMPLFYAFSVGLHAAAGQPDEGLRDFARATELAPTFGLPYFHAGTAYVEKGELDKALEALQQGSHFAIHPGWAEAIIVAVRLAQGRRDEAQQVFAEMVEQKRTVPVSATAIGWAAAQLGDLDSAFAWFERAIEERDQLMVFLHLYTPRYGAPLLADARYEALLERLGLGDSG